MANKRLIKYSVVLVSLVIIFFPGFCRYQELRAKDRELRERIKQLEIANAKLSLEKRMLEEDSVYVEKVAREKLGIVREGEVVYKLEE